MKEKNKELLLKDLSARAPYGVKVSLQTGKRELTGVLDAVYPSDERVIVDNLSEAIAPIDVRVGGFLVERDNVKPYLRQLSDLTEKEKKEYSMFIPKTETYKQQTCLDSDSMCGSVIGRFPCVYLSLFDKFVDWLLKHHIDFRGLIAKGLALKAPEGMYKNK